MTASLVLISQLLPLSAVVVLGWLVLSPRKRMARLHFPTHTAEKAWPVQEARARTAGAGWGGVLLFIRFIHGRVDDIK